MPNGIPITAKEIGTEANPARPGQEHGTLTGWIQDLVFTVDHKKLGLMYLGVGWLFFVVAGTMAAIIRTQLIVPNNNLASPQPFNSLFPTHGTSMIFFVAMPMFFDLAYYMVPLRVGARDLVFPRLHAFSFWLTAYGACV